MIKTKNLNKYFNRNKNNEIHVINNTSLAFPNKGLITLSGESGSGKTTLLNVISGLDRVDGTIDFDNKEIKKYKSSTWDKIRAHDIGYVFQNYHLLEDRSVYDNIKLTLNMIGIVDEAEVDYRVIYVLKAVGMYRFRKKRASNLSGGQKQRVAIARAIAKNPKVIIADEPTGNLDSKNSIEVMKIIKKISEERLVVLVTHETKLANQYSDRIIKIKDGSVVSNDENNEVLSDDLIYDDQNIYLNDLEKTKLGNNTHIYSNDENIELGLRIVKVGNKYYLEALDDNVELSIINNKSSVKLIEDTKENALKEQINKTDFSLDELEKIKTKRVKKRTLPFKDAFIEALRKVTNLGKKSKFQIITLILLGMMFSVAVHTLFSNLVFDDSKIYTSPEIYSVDSSLVDNELLNNHIVFSPNNKGSFNRPVFILNNRSMEFNIEQTLPSSALSTSDLVAGRLPENDFEVVIDVSLLSDDYEKNYYFKAAGFNKAEDLLKAEFKTDRYGPDLGTNIIVGVTNNNSKALYFTENKLFGIAFDFIINYEDPDSDQYIEKSYAIEPIKDTVVSEGVMPTPMADKEPGAPLEILINIKFKEFFPLNEQINVYQLKDIVIPVGYYTSSSDSLVFKLIDEELNEIKLNLYKNVYYRHSVYLNDASQEVIDKYRLQNTREFEINSQKAEQELAVNTSITQMVIALIVSGVIFYFLVRSGLTSRVKEISILRSLGVSKSEVVSVYSLEYFILTTITSLIGVIIGTYITNAISSSFLGTAIAIRITPYSILVAVIAIFVSNILIALIPVGMLLRKTPAQMLTSYDI